MIAKMIQFSWQRSVFDETGFLFTPPKVLVLQQEEY